VPEALRGSSEVVVTLMLYSQYPGGRTIDADGVSFSDGISGNTQEQMRVHSVTMVSRRFDPPQQPPVARPRMFGDNAYMYKNFLRYQALPCRANEWSNLFGDVPSMRKAYDRLMFGIEGLCEDASMLPGALEGLALNGVADYLTKTPAELLNGGTNPNAVVYRQRFKRVVAFYRIMRACLDPAVFLNQKHDYCNLYGATALDALARAVVDKEMEIFQLGHWSWVTFPGKLGWSAGCARQSCSVLNYL